MAHSDRAARCRSGPGLVGLQACKRNERLSAGPVRVLLVLRMTDAAADDPEAPPGPYLVPTWS